MRKRNKTAFLILITLVIGFSLAVQGGSNTKPQKELLRVGVYDSRAIAGAYAAKYRRDLLIKEQELLQQAQKENDIEKIKELIIRRQEEELKSNLQGLGIEPVHECFEPIKDKIPEIAKKAGVDILINKWSMDFTAENAGFVDLTDELVKLYDPSAGTLEWIESLKKTKPVNQQAPVNIGQ